MQATYIYHVTSPTWLKNGVDRLCFRHYVRPPAHQPYRDHAQLNAAQEANPGSNVFAAFFFSDEVTAVATAFEVLAYNPHVVLRASVSDPALLHLLRAEDDRALTQGAHMRYGHDTSVPVDIYDGYRVHASWGIPFEQLEIKDASDAPWIPIADYIR